MKRMIIVSLLVLLNAMAGAQGEQAGFFKPIEQSVKLSTGISMQYVEQGVSTGMPVILLHGYTDSWHSYESVLPYLPSWLHVFALTQRGHGNTSKPERGYHPRDFAADVAAFIRSKQLGSAVIVGHSMGGAVAQQFALDFPGLTKALVIIDSESSFKENTGLQEFFKEVSRLMDPVSYEMADQFQRSTLANPIDSVYYGVLVRETLKLPARIWKATLAGLMEADYTAKLHTIGQPVLLMWGDKDMICSREAQYLMQKQFPEASLKIYEQTGHALHWERPELFAKDLVDFINEFF